VALALYRKYRPRTFAEVIGQEHVTEPLSQALRSGRLHHAYLFSGPRGCGKTSSARILARSLNCEQGPTPDPCGVCASCRSLANDGAGSIDVIEIDAASHGGVDDARDLREKAFFAPASSRYKIYVIDEAHMVSSAGFNALLKLVEEPPDYVKFIFATTEPDKVLGTIRSRTHHYPFRLIPPATLRPYLQQLTEAEGVHVEPAVLPLVVRAGGGSARDTLSVLDQLIAGAGPEGVSYARAVSLLGVTDVALIDEMCDAIAAGDGAAAYATINRVAEAGHDARRFASDLLERFRDLIILQQVPDAVAKGLIDGPADQLDAMSAQATRLGPATLSRCADIVHNGLVEMRGTTAPRLLLELITARMLLPGADDSSGALLQRLERMERRLTLSADADGVRAEPEPPAASSPAESGGISAARAAAGRRAPAGGLAAAPPPPPEPGADDDYGAPAAPEPRPADLPGPPPGSVAAGPPPGRAVSSGAPSGSTLPAGPLPGPAAAPGSPSGPAAAPGSPSGPAAASGSPSGPAAASGSPSGPVAAPAPQARRPEPAAVMPDAPEEPGLEPVSPAVPGQLTAAAVREVWPEIITTVGRKSKKIAALASGATVRELDGQTVVLTFRFPAHAKMVNDQPQVIVDALYEALGGRWQLRCEVAGEAGAAHVAAPAGPAARTAAPAPAQSAPARPAAEARPARQRDAGGSAAGAPRATQTAGSGVTAGSADDTDDWPEPARPGGALAPSVAPPVAADRPGGPESDGGARSVAANGSAPTAPGATDIANGSPRSGIPATGATVGGAGAAAAGEATVRAADPVTGVAAARAALAARQTGAKAAPQPGGRAAPEAGGRTSAQAGGRTAAQPGGRTAAQPGGRPAAQAGGRPAQPAGKAAAWADGSPTEEAPYDPEYDGPPGAGAPGAAYEGFDPGDEPLDDVIDEKTARQSSEQQAMQLLQEAFGAEKIGES
jgi:DNA polymerase-3 subunit gamma/tau